MATLNLKVGASVDRNLQVAFRPLVEGAKRAAVAIEAENKKMARAIEREAKSAATNEAKQYAAAAREIGKWAKEAASAAAKAKRDETRAFEQEEKAKTRIANREHHAREREAAKAARAHEQRISDAKKIESNKGLRSSANAGLSRAGRMAVGVGRAAVGAAFGLGSSMVRGMGVETDAGAIFKQNVDMETLASKLSNQGYQAGDARNGTRIDPNTLMQEALAVGKATGTDANDALEGLTKFVDTTGDLTTARAAFKDLAVLSKATGTNLEDMLQAAGQVSVALGDIPNKGEAINAVMRSFAGQGKLGAVEVKDLAVQMAKISASAGSFGGSRSNTLATLGALAQNSRAMGGSVSAAGAATSVASFVSMLTTKRRAEEFEKATGAKTFDKKTGLLRDPQQIIQEALAKVGMDPIKMKTIFASQQGARAMMGFANIYRQAGGGEKGAAAVDAEFARLKNAAVSEAEIMESFNRAMRTSASQADVFNNAVRSSALEMQNSLKPAIVELAPVVAKAVSDLSGLITTIVGHDAATRAEVTGAAASVAANDPMIAKSLASGAISQELIDKVKADARAAQVASGGAQVRVLEGERDKADFWGLNVLGGPGKTNTLTRTLARAGDYNPVTAVVNSMLGGSAKKTFEKEDAQQAAKVQQAEAAKRVATEAVSTMNYISMLLDNKVIQVRVTTPIPAGVTPPGTPTAGVQPTPEQKAEAY